MMLTRSAHFNLGADTDRMQPADTARQNATVDHLLKRLYASDKHECLPFQLLADEVGMGKTFVALATAFSVLEHLQDAATQHPHLRGCLPKIVVLSPNAGALYQKWVGEVGDFVKRCVAEPTASTIAQTFQSTGLRHFDEVVGALNREDGPSVVVTYTGAFSRKLNHSRAKQRATLGALFRFWGVRYPYKERHRLLGAIGQLGWGWGHDPSGLGTSWLPVGEQRLVQALRDHQPATVEALLSELKAITRNYVRRRAARVRQCGLGEKLRRIYRALIPHCLDGDLPLVIVDEAHNWKNFRSGFPEFRDQLAPHTRRLLMLSATPFQLHPSEILSLFQVSEFLRGSRKSSRIKQLRQRVQNDRAEVIVPVLNASADASRHFARAWQKLPRRINSESTSRLLRQAWGKLESVREQLRQAADEPGAVSRALVAKLADQATADAHPDLRELLRRALRLYAFNRDLSAELGSYVVRHRRSADHRLFQVGEEFVDPSKARKRPDHHILHAANGLDVRGDGELPHYLLMRAITELKGGKGRSALGSALTGCYSTLLGSAQGRKLEAAAEGTRARLYVDLLKQSVSQSQDSKHPKVSVVVNDTVKAWGNGEKTLIFCFRVNTAERLRDIIEQRIERRLRYRLHKVLGSEDALRALRGRLSSREGDLMTIGLDRILLSVCRALGIQPPDASLQDQDIQELARLSLRYDVPLDDKRLDRVFLHRSLEHIAARRLLPTAHEALHPLLQRMAEPAWVERAYGLSDTADTQGVHTVYSSEREPSKEQVLALETELRERRLRAGERAVLDAAWDSPSLWFDDTHRALHRHLWKLGLDDEGLRERREIFSALRDGVRWKGILLRLLDERSADQSWAETLVLGFQTPPRGQTESMLDRFAVFTEDLVNASGSVLDPETARGLKFSATRLQAGQSPVRLVKGGDLSGRQRIFQGFNSPLLPEVLVCTSVGQEGIDLHRHCQRVIHYDLAWNPAVIEQRTGRVDRIGSKTFRERRNDPSITLDIGVPFLAGTYDERMYEELRLRAQTFEVLTGGELSKGNRVGEEDEGQESDLSLVALPPELVADLRVELGVVGIAVEE